MRATLRGCSENWITNKSKRISSLTQRKAGIIRKAEKRKTEKPIEIQSTTSAEKLEWQRTSTDADNRKTLAFGEACPTTTLPPRLQNSGKAPNSYAKSSRP